jgi:thioredoxin-like negative regulator of GroEL
MTVENNYEKLKEIIEKNSLVFLYFSGENCAVCKVLKPKIEELFAQQFPAIKLIEIQTDKALDTTAQLGVFSLPTMMLYIEQKEFFRKGRNVSLALLVEEIKRVYALFLQKE